MKLHELNACHLLATGVSLGKLCKLLSKLAGVEFTHRRRFFWSSEDIRAEFIFCGHRVKVEPDPWDDSIWIMPANEAVLEFPEFQRLRDHLAQFCVSK